MASTRLSRTQTAGTRTKFTISAWIKRTGDFGSYNHLFTNSPNPGAWDTVRFDNDDQLAVRFNNDTYVIKTNRKFRDTNGWYHIVISVDTTQATASNRVKIYVNGVQETSLASSSYPTQNFETNFNRNSETFQIGANTWSNNQFFTGLMSHVHYVDGTAYTASTFGSTDSTTGEWKINTSPSVTYGTNGFFILKDGNSVTDQSGEGNNLTVGAGTLTKTEDCPSNVFATINPLNNYYPASTFSQGNNTIATANANRSYNNATLGASSGKYYWEVKGISNVTSSNGCYLGIASTNPTNDGVSSARYLGYKQYDYAYMSGNGNWYTNDNTTSYGDTYGDNDIVGVAMDLDNNKLYFSKNGTWQNSGDPTSGATGTGAISIEDPSGTLNGVYTPSVGDYWTSGFTVSFNFGNGYFGTTAVSSAGANASGNGIFEYDVPTGYTALSTTGLNL
jgi:hypothetical protein